MLLLRGDKIQLRDGRVLEVIDVWVVARCHAKVKCEARAVSFIIAENDVDAILRRLAIRKSKFID